MVRLPITYFQNILVAVLPIECIDDFKLLVTPSEKARTDITASPSGKIQAARSGTMLRHFTATQLAAIR